MKCSVQLLLVFPVMCLWMPGCGGDASPVVQTRAPVGTSNGTSFNGVSYAGYSLQTTYLSSYSAPTMFLAPTTSAEVPTYDDFVKGVGPNGTSYSDTDVQAVSAPETDLTGFDLVGLVLTGELEDGSTVGLEVEDAIIQNGLFLYRVGIVTQMGHDVPLCGLGTDGAPIRALAVPGVWDLRAGEVGGGSWNGLSGEFTFACRKSSIAKCVELGYMPDIRNGTPQEAAHLEACVRMLRADYCGDGTSWTTNGRIIDVWDLDGINLRAEETWPLEAVWGSGGALCLNDPRYLFPEDAAVPGCLPRLERRSCDSAMSEGLLFESYRRAVSVEEANGASALNDLVRQEIEPAETLRAYMDGQKLR